MSYNHENGLPNDNAQEMEIVEFLLKGTLYGIQTIFVREIVLSAPVHSSRRTYPALEGICRLADRQALVLDISRYFGSGGAKPLPQDLFVVANCKQINMAFRANMVAGILRITPQEFAAPGRKEREAMGDTVVGVVHREDERIVILNLENLADELAAELAI